MVDNSYLVCDGEAWYNIDRTDKKQTENVMRDYSFGNFLHELRLRSGLTQYQLGLLIGVSDKAVSKWENGSSMPQSSVLYKLSEALGVSVDELLSCKYHSFEKKDTKGVFATKKQLWNKAFDAMRERYGNPVPIEIVNRFLTEQAEMQNTDSIVYFDMLSVLSSAAKKRHDHVMVKGGTGSSLVAYLLGATEINPLKPHYCCTACHRVVFDDSAADGWDLPPKECICGRAMIADGHDIPFESCRHEVNHGSHVFVSVSPDFFRPAVECIEDYFKECTLTRKEWEADRFFTIKVSSESAEGSVAVIAAEEYTRFQTLAQATATSFDRIPFASDEILREFQRGSTDGILEFHTKYMKNMLHAVRANSFHDLIQIFGLCHGTGVWTDNAGELVAQGCPVGKVIAYGDDVFRHMQEKMISKGLADTGFAYAVMENTRRGLYAKNGIPHDIKMQLKSIGVDDWFIDSIGKIKILMHKAHGVSYVRLAAMLMWYKLHYPKEFNEIML